MGGSLAFDWECDPRHTSCPGQYGIPTPRYMPNDFVENETKNTENEPVEYFYDEEPTPVITTAVPTPAPTAAPTPFRTPAPTEPAPTAMDESWIQEKLDRRRQKLLTGATTPSPKSDARFENDFVDMSESAHLTENSSYQTVLQNAGKTENGTPIVQNIIDFRPMFEGIFGKPEGPKDYNKLLDEIDLYAAQAYPVQLKRMQEPKPVDDSLIAELKVSNRRLQSKVA